MNILFINSIGRDKFGGGEKWMVHAAKGLYLKGHNVTLASKNSSRILQYAKKLDVPTQTINIRSDISPLKTIRIARWIKQHRIDILVCNLNKDVRVAGLAARIAGTPVVLARHGMLLCGRKWKHKLTLTNLTDGIITNSNTIRDSYRDYGWFEQDFIKVIYNGLSIPEQVTPVNFSDRFPGKKIIYSAGRLAEQKGFTYLIDAAAILLKKRDDLVFIVSGEGKLETELKTKTKALGIDESFIFEGFADNIFPYLKGADIFVLASLFEGMPNVVMEAMAMEKPVVATDVNGARELIEEGKTGLIVPPADPAALSGAIDVLCQDPETGQRMGSEGKERVARHFTQEKMTDELERFLLKKLHDKLRIHEER